MTSTSQHQPKKNILIVEDDIVLNQFLQKHLELSGYATTSLSDGENIPRVIERNQISLVVLDIELPGKNGYYWLEWFKNYHPFIPIIIDTINNRVRIGHRNISLTKQECKILQLFYMNESIPLSRDELCLQTIGSPHIPGSRTIDIHINRLRVKIENNPSKPSYIRTIRGKGYCFYLSNNDQLES